MLQLLKTPSRSALGLCGVLGAALMMLLGAGQARAADIYPAGAGTFSGGAQGWQVTDASCNVPILCSATGGYDGSDGQPPGSVAANTSILLNLVGLFKSTVTLQSPDFTVADRWRRHPAPRPPVRSGKPGRPGAAVHLHGDAARPHGRKAIGAADGDDRRGFGLHRQGRHGERRRRPHLRDLDRDRDQLERGRHRRARRHHQHPLRQRLALERRRCGRRQQRRQWRQWCRQQRWPQRPSSALAQFRAA